MKESERKIIINKEERSIRDSRTQMMIVNAFKIHDHQISHENKNPEESSTSAKCDRSN